MLILSAKNSCGGMLERREDKEEISGTQRGSPSSLVSISGTSISGLSLNIKIAQAPHHWAYPVKNVIESCKIPVLVSSICHWLDLSGYDGSSVGCQWDYSIAQLPDQYHFLDIWDHFRLSTPPCNKFLADKFLTISCKGTNISTSSSLFTPILVEMNPSLEGIHSKCFLMIPFNFMSYFLEYCPAEL